MPKTARLPENLLLFAKLTCGRVVALWPSSSDFDTPETATANLPKPQVETILGFRRRETKTRSGRARFACLKNALHLSSTMQTTMSAFTG